MALNIIVCLKQVARTDARLEPDTNGKCVKEEGLSFDINECDAYAMEEAYFLKGRHQGKITAVTLGPKRCREVLFNALARGADEAVHVVDEIHTSNISSVGARILSEVIRPLHPDIVLTGIQADDDGLGYFGIALAKHLSMPHVSACTKIELTDPGRVLVTREAGGGWSDIMQVSLPAVFTIQYGIQALRYMSVLSLMRVRNKPIRTLDLSSLPLRSEELANEDRLEVLEVYTPPKRRSRMISGGTNEVVASLLDVLKTEAGVL